MCAGAGSCTDSQGRRRAGVLFYCSPSYSIETRSPIEPGAGLAASKPEGSSCSPPPPHHTVLITDVHTAEVQFRSSYPGKCSYLPKAISPAPNFLNLKIVIMYNKITLLLNSERQTVRQIDRQRQREEEGESDVMSSSISVQVFETGSLH